MLHTILESMFQDFPSVIMGGKWLLSCRCQPEHHFRNGIITEHNYMPGLIYGGLLFIKTVSVSAYKKSAWVTFYIKKWPQDLLF